MLAELRERQKPIRAFQREDEILRRPPRTLPSLEPEAESAMRDAAERAKADHVELFN